MNTTPTTSNGRSREERIANLEQVAAALGDELQRVHAEVEELIDR